MTSQRMRLFAFDFQGPAHLSAGLWRHELDQGARYKDLRYWTDYAKLLEQARFDGIFFADNVGYHDIYQGSADGALADAAQIPANDPLLWSPAMAASPKTWASAVTGSTSYEHPYALARRFSTLDHLTNGRVGWNLVTSYSDSAARNLGTGQQTPHDERYDVAAEYLEVCYKLWEGSWEDDAVVSDPGKRCLCRPQPRARHQPPGQVLHRARFRAVRTLPAAHPGDLSGRRLVQGPCAGRSTAEAVFVNAVSIPALKRQVDALRERPPRSDATRTTSRCCRCSTSSARPPTRPPRQSTSRYRKLVSYAGAMARYSGWTGLDMAQFDPDVPLKHVKTNAGQTMVDLFSKMDPDKEWTPRDIAEFIGIGGTGPTIVGSPTTVADELTRWMDETGMAGYNFAHAVKYQDIADFIELVVPELQRRGTMWTQYDGSTLREKLYGPGAIRLRDDHPGHRIAHPTADATP